MSLETLMNGFVKPEIAMHLRSFNDAESPVPCSSDIMISPDSADRPNLIRKTKKAGKRSDNPIKLVWEYIQYEALNRLFKSYQAENGINVVIAKPLAVFPREYSLFTEFMPGFILKDFDKQVKKGFFVKHYCNKEIRVECSVAFFLGYLSKIKQMEGIYHSDYDSRHIIYNAGDIGVSMIDFENTRHLSDRTFVDAESEFLRKEWYNLALRRGCDRKELNRHYDEGIRHAKRISTSYTKILDEVAAEYGVSIRPSAGVIDKIDVGLKKEQIREYN
jgi:hypothetical protein